MAALKAHEVRRYLAHPPRRTGLFLAYGTDPGLVREVAQTLALHCAGGRRDDVVTLEQADIDADPGRLAVEARTPSLFGDAPVVRVRAGGRNLLASLEALGDDFDQSAVIVEAGNLTQRDPLRVLAERAPAGVTLPCYPDDERSLGELVRESFAKEGVTVDPDVVPALVATLGNDREVTRREIEKLMVFAAESKRITRDDVLTLCADNSALVLDAIADAAGTGHAQRLDAALCRARLAAVSSQQILTMNLNHFARLRRWRAEVDAGRAARAVLDAVRPKPHFSRMAALEQQLRLWSDDALAGALDRLHRAVAESRRAAALDEPLARRALLAICRMAAER
jgi:DNA polymerase-3 subunit delta